MFHEHTLQGKGNLYDFYHVLVLKTDNANVSDTIVSTNLLTIPFALKTYKIIYLVSLQGISSGFPDLAKSHGIEAWWTWP